MAPQLQTKTGESMGIHPWQESAHFAIVKAWANHRRESFPPGDLLPETGVLISTSREHEGRIVRTYRAAAWYTFDSTSRWGHVDLLITNPANGLLHGTAYGLTAVSVALDILQNLGAKIVLATTRHPWLTENAAKLGFQPLERGIDSIAWLPPSSDSPEPL